jgi:serine/threonine protein kinase
VDAITLLDNNWNVYRAYRISFRWKSESVSVIREWSQFVALNSVISRTLGNMVKPLITQIPLFRTARDPVVVAERRNLLQQWWIRLLQCPKLDIKAIDNFLSPQLTPPYKSLGDPEKEGHLIKEGHIIRSWKRRWFILKGNTLFYFTTRECLKLAGLIRLIHTEILAAPEKQREYCFKIRPLNLKPTQKPYFVCATKQQDYDEWMSVLSSRIEELKKNQPIEEPLTTTSKDNSRIPFQRLEGSQNQFSGVGLLKPRPIEWDRTRDDGSMVFNELKQPEIDPSQLQNTIEEPPDLQTKFKMGLKKLKESQINQDLKDFQEDLRELRLKLKEIEDNQQNESLKEQLLGINEHNITALEELTLKLLQQTVEDFLSDPPQAKNLTLQIMGLYEAKQQIGTDFTKPYVTRLLFIFSKLARILEYYSNSRLEDAFLELKEMEDSTINPPEPVSTAPTTGFTATPPVNIKQKSKHKKLARSLMLIEDNSLRLEGAMGLSLDTAVASTPSVTIPLNGNNVTNVTPQPTTSAPLKTSKSSSRIKTKSTKLKKPGPVVCRLCELIIDLTKLDIHSTFCALTQKCDIINQACDVRLHILIDVMKVAKNYLEFPDNYPELPDAIKKYSKEDIMVQLNQFDILSRIACEASDVSHVQARRGIQKLDYLIQEVTNIASTHQDYISIITFTKKLKSLISDKYYSIDEYATLVKARPIQEELPASLQTSTLKDKWLGFISLFGRKKENALQDRFRPNTAPHSNAIPNPSLGPPPPLPARKITIRDFQILKPISRGSFGRVYLARKIKTGDLYAIKVLRKTDIIRKNQEDTVMTERNAMARANHPFVVQLYFAFQSKRYLYLVMEYLIGGDLATLLGHFKYFEEPVAKRYLAETVLVLEYIHSINIVHRDLKPDNLLINEDGHLKMTDFGLSKVGVWNNPEKNQFDPLRDLVTSSNPYGKINDDDRTVGTPDYLSPEILLGTGHGFAVDWWAIGVMAFELLVGCPPFADDSPEKIFQNILNRDMFEWPSAIPVSNSAKDFVDKLLCLDPNRRLGANGADEIKNHPFFAGIDWANVLTTPMDDIFIPKPIDTSNFKDKVTFEDSFVDNKNQSTKKNYVEDFNVPEFSFKNLHHLREKNLRETAEDMNQDEYSGDYSSDETEDEEDNNVDSDSDD